MVERERVDEEAGGRQREREVEWSGVVAAGCWLLLLVSNKLVDLHAGVVGLLYRLLLVAPPLATPPCGGCKPHKMLV